MKQFITALALATLTAAPAFAATHHKMPKAAADAYASADSNLVVVGGQVVGADPDQNIRFQIERDNGLLAN